MKNRNAIIFFVFSLLTSSYYHDQVNKQTSQLNPTNQSIQQSSIVFMEMYKTQVKVTAFEQCLKKWLTNESIAKPLRKKKRPNIHLIKAFPTST